MVTKTAVIYARVSDRKQVDEDVSLPSQVEECRKKAEALGAAVTRVFIDEGRTGRHTDRPAFQDAIAFCELNSPAFFITWSTSRFARNRWDAALYKRRLSAVGTEMQYITLNVDRSNAGGRALEAFFEIIDELQSDQIAADTRRSMMRNAREGYRNGGRPPFGFCAVADESSPKRKRLAPFEPEAEIVRRIVARRLNGDGAKTIANMLSAEHVTNRGRRWTRSAVSDLLRNEALIGNTIFGKKDRVTGRRRPRGDWIIVKSHNPIITLDQWISVQQLMNEAAPTLDDGSPLSRFLFTGILKCGRCGSSMQTESAKGRSQRYHYYNCRSAQISAQCQSRRISARAFDDWMAEVIVNRVFTEENLTVVLTELETVCGSWTKDRQRRRMAVIQELQSFQDRNSRLYEVLELHGQGAPHLGDLTKRLRHNNEQIKRIEQTLIEIDAEASPEITISQADVAELSEFLAETIRSANNVTKVRHFLGSFISAIRIGDTDVQIEYTPESLIQKHRELLMVPGTAGWLPERSLLGTVLLQQELPERFRLRVA